MPAFAAGHVFAVTDDGEVVAWDPALAVLTNRSWQTVRSGSCETAMQMWRATDGTPMCYLGCPMLAAARCGRSECARTLIWLGADGGHPALLTTISAPAVGDQRPTVVHFVRPLPALDSLTPQEVRVLAHLDQGASTVSIAQSLGIRVATVRTHVRNVMAKLGANSRLQAVSLLRL